MLGEIVEPYDTATPITGYRFWVFTGEALRSTTFTGCWPRDGAVTARPCGEAYAFHQQSYFSELHERAPQAYKCNGPPCTNQSMEPVLYAHLPKVTSLHESEWGRAVDIEAIHPQYCGYGCGRRLDSVYQS